MVLVWAGRDRYHAQRKAEKLARLAEQQAKQEVSSELDRARRLLQSTRQQY